MPPINLKPIGFHFKNNPIKALYYRNFYEPNPRALDKFVTIENKGAEELYENIVPYKTLIGNYAKAKGLSVDLKCAKTSEFDMISFNYATLDKKGRKICPMGVILHNFDANNQESRIGEQIAKLFKRALKQ